MERLHSSTVNRQNARCPAANGLNAKRHALFALIVFLFAAAFYCLSVRLISQIHFLRTDTFFEAQNFSLALEEMKKVDLYQPYDYTVKRGLAKVYYQLSVSEKEAPKAFAWARKSKDSALKASRLNPLDAETFYDLALAEARLEQLYPSLHFKNEPNPYQALPYFKQALHLRPNSVLYQFVLARYFARSNREQELLSTVRVLSRSYPLIYHHLKKEAFWSPPVKEAVIQGLKQAVDAGILLKEAHRFLSELLAEKDNYAEAITHYQVLLQYQGFKTTVGNYVHLGRLYLKNGQLGQAESSFMKALSRNRTTDKELKSIYHSYKNEGYLEELYRLLQKADRRFALSSQMNILMARSLIDLERLSQAQNILEDIIRKEPSAEAYYWIARITEQEKDWDNMELSIQKATVFEPANSQYHFLFSRALQRQGKLERAEKEADRAINLAAKPDFWLFNHRGWVKWSRKDFKGAANDWQKAIKLKPERAAFYAQVGMAGKKIGDRIRALEYYQKAVQLDPENEGYKKIIRELQRSKE